MVPIAVVHAVPRVHRLSGPRRSPLSDRGTGIAAREGEGCHFDVQACHAREVFVALYGGGFDALQRAQGLRVDVAGDGPGWVAHFYFGISQQREVRVEFFSVAPAQIHGLELFELGSSQVDDALPSAQYQVLHWVVAATRACTGITGATSAARSHHGTVGKPRVAFRVRQLSGGAIRDAVEHGYAEVAPSWFEHERFSPGWVQLVCDELIDRGALGQLVAADCCSSEGLPGAFQVARPGAHRIAVHSAWDQQSAGVG